MRSLLQRVRLSVVKPMQEILIFIERQTLCTYRFAYVDSQGKVSHRGPNYFDNSTVRSAHCKHAFFVMINSIYTLHRESAVFSHHQSTVDFKTFGSGAYARSMPGVPRTLHPPAELPPSERRGEGGYVERSEVIMQE